MRSGRHAADDGSSNRSAGMAVGRGAALLAIAVILGIVLLNAVDDGPTDRVRAGGGATPATLPPDDASTTLPEVTTTTAAPRAPAEVKVLSANATDVRGAAGKARDVLRTSGYNVLAPLDAKGRVDASVVYFNAGLEREAQAVAGVLGLPATAAKPLPTPPPVADLRGADVVVVVGPDLAARLVGTPSTTKPTTATTRAATTTTAASGTTSTS